MLPPFRVKKLLPRSEAGPSVNPQSDYLQDLRRRLSSGSGSGSVDGIIRMSRQAYDDLLEREPDAALTYLDEEDGEVVLVGSAFELGHRLQDALPRPPYRLGTAEFNAAVLGMPPTHAFDIQRRDNIIAEWQELERKTVEAREENRRGQQIPVPLSQHTLEPIEPVTNVGGYVFPAGEGEMEEATLLTTPNKTAKFGESSPLSKNAPKLSMTEKRNEGHAKRWASYSSMPGIFDPALSNAVEKSARFMEEQEEKKRKKMEESGSGSSVTPGPSPSHVKDAPKELCNAPYTLEELGLPRINASHGAKKEDAVPAKENLDARSSNIFTNSTVSSSVARWTSSHGKYDVPDFVLASGDTLSPEELRLMGLTAGQQTKAEADSNTRAKEARAASSKPISSSNPSINKTTSSSTAFRTGRTGEYDLPDFVFATGDALSPEELRWAAYDKETTQAREKEKTTKELVPDSSTVDNFFGVSDWEGDLHDSPANTDVLVAQGEMYQRQVVLRPEEEAALSTAFGIPYVDYLASLKPQPASIAAAAESLSSASKTLHPAVQSTPDVKQTEGYQPLLSHFQEQLQRLGTSNTTNNVEPTTAPAAPEKVPDLRIDAPSQAKDDPVEARLADSLRSISLGVGQLVAAVQSSKVELNNTLNPACQDFPRGLKEAVKAGANAVDVLRGVPVQSAAQVPSAVDISQPLNTEANPPKVATSAAKPSKAKVLPDGQKDKVLWIPRRIVTRRQICYGPEVNTTMHEVEYLVTWLDRPLADAVWYKESMIMQVPLLKALADAYNKSMAIRATHSEPANTVFDGMIARGHERFHQETIGNFTVPALRHFPGSTQRRHLRHIPESSEDFKRLPQVLRAVAIPMPATKPVAGLTHCVNDGSSSSKDHSKVGTESVLPLNNSKPDPNRSRPWVESEDHLLQELMRGKDRAILSHQVWVDMAKKFINRSPEQLKPRWKLLSQQKVQAPACCGPLPEIKKSEPIPRDPVKFKEFEKQKQSEAVAAKSRNVNKPHSLVKPQVCDPTHWDLPVGTAKLPTPAPAVTQTAPRSVPIWAQTASQNSSEHAHDQNARAPHASMMYHYQLGSNNSWYGTPANSNIAYYASGMNQGYIPPVGPQPVAMLPQVPMPAVPAIQIPGVAGGALADYQMQLMLLEQQNKRRLAMARQEQDVAGPQTGGVEEMPQPNWNVQGTALEDYQMQLMLLEQQNKRRLMMARQEQDLAGKQHADAAEASARSSSFSGLQAPLMPSILNSKVSKLTQDPQPQGSVNAYQATPTVDVSSVNTYAATPATNTAGYIDDRAMYPAPTQQQPTRVNPAFQEVCAGVIPDVFHRFQDELWQVEDTGPENSQALDNAANGINWIMAHPHSDAGIEYEPVQLQHMVKTLRTLLAPIPLDNIQRLSKYRMLHEGGSYRMSDYDNYSPYYNSQPSSIGNVQSTAPPVPARPLQYDAQQSDIMKEVLSWPPPPPAAAYRIPSITAQPTQPSSASRLIIDRCVTTLLDMGYEPRSRVEAIAASADGDFHTAMDLLEEDEKMQSRIKKGKGKADPNQDLSVPGGWGAWDGWDVGNFEEDSGVEGLD